MPSARDLHDLRLAIRDVPSVHGLLLAAAALAAASCATPQAPSGSSAEEAAPAPVLTEEGRRNLENVYLFNCAPEYLPYPEGQGPPVPARSDAEWRERREELTACGRRVARRYATLDTIRALAWNGKTHSMSEAEMKGMAQQGPAYVADYVEELLQRERRRAQLSSTVAGEVTP
jgi:hypothetical protein